MLRCLETLLGQATIASWRAHRAARRRAARPLAVLDLYRANPFRILALDPAEADTRAVLRRRDELRAMAAAGLDPARNLAGVVSTALWPDEPAAGLRTIERATGQLQSTPERLRQELFWFHLAGEDHAVRGALARCDLGAAVEVWRRRAGPGDASAGQALHNLAIACHLRVLDEERHAPLRRRGLGALGRAWRESLELWARVVETDTCWETLASRAAALSDPRLNGPFLDGLRRMELPMRVLGINAALARAAADLGRRRFVRLHLELLRSSRFPEEARQGAERAFFAHAVDAVELALNPLASAHPRSLDEVDAKELVSSVRKAVASVKGFGGSAVLARETAGSWRSAQRRTREQLHLAVAAFRGTDRELWQLQQTLVAMWNRVMERHNRFGAYGSDIELQGILAAFRTAGARLPELDSPLARVRRTAKSCRRILSVLRDLAADGAGGPPSDLGEDLTWAREALRVTTREAQMTRDHHQRNVVGMAANVGYSP